jgi:hypothetical protein
MIIEIRYLEKLDQTQILVETNARIYSCHWAGRADEKDIRAAMARKEIVFLPWSQGTAEYVQGHARRFTK